MQSVAPMTAAVDRPTTKPFVLPSTAENNCGTLWYVRNVTQYPAFPMFGAVGGALPVPVSYVTEPVPLKPWACAYMQPCWMEFVGLEMLVGQAVCPEVHTTLPPQL